MEQGLAVAAEGFDAAVIDIMLPGIDGLEVIAQLRGQGGVPVAHTRIEREEIG